MGKTGSCHDTTPCAVVTSANCVQVNIEPLDEMQGVCKGDPASSYFLAIMSLLASILVGGIKVEGVDLSNVISELRRLIGKNSDSIKTLVERFEDEVRITIPSDTCFGVVSSKNDFYNKVVSKVCDLVESVSELSSTVNQGGSNYNTFVTNIANTVASKIVSKNGGVHLHQDGTIELLGMIPIGGRIWGDFDLTKFDSSGKGLQEFQNFHICNGLDGIPDIREYGAYMASANVPAVSRAARTLFGSTVGSVKTVAHLPVNQSGTGASTSIEGVRSVMGYYGIWIQRIK